MKLSLVTAVLLLIVLSGTTVQGKETVSGNSSVVSLTTGKVQGQIQNGIYVYKKVCRNARCTFFLVHHYINRFIFFKLR